MSIENLKGLSKQERPSKKISEQGKEPADSMELVSDAG